MNPLFYIRETPCDDNHYEFYEAHKCFLDKEGREPFDDNELFMFIDTEYQSMANDLLAWENF